MISKEVLANVKKLATAMCDVIGYTDDTMVFAVETAAIHYQVKLPPLTTKPVLDHCKDHIYTPWTMVEEMTFVMADTIVTFDYTNGKKEITEKPAVDVQVLSPAKFLKNYVSMAIDCTDDATPF